MPTWRQTWLLACAIPAALLAGCGWDGHFDIFGYTTRPNYDTSICTVYVPIFQNVIMRANTSRTLEFDLTKAVIREIEAKTPYKVVETGNADTELIGKITQLNKTLINQNQLGEVRDAQVILAAEIIWRDLRPGHLGESLSAQRQGGTGMPPPGALAPPVLVTSYGTFKPELGGSITTAEQEAVDRMAVQIVSMMEVWKIAPPVLAPALGP
jgi:hypothetical protein